MMPKIRICFRIDKEILYNLSNIADELRWSLSSVIRYLISVSYSMLRPDVRIDADDLIEYIEKEKNEQGEIETWKLVRFIAPKAIEKIEAIEEELKRKKNSDE